ncbi:H1_5 [Mytilus coruscus]|uniref:H1_5 n=1 Tax=Mytilus coruscus TaxID=42192 RepID=A0A6J8D479_MYTCO|nr:H1_5 [Mytilus coruscus]
MADVAAPAPAKSPKKKAAAKPKKPSAHPKYSEMIGKAIAALKERGGSSRQAILKYIMANFNVGKDAKSVNAHLKLALRAGVKNNSLKQSRELEHPDLSELERQNKLKKANKGKKAVKPKAAKPKKAKSTPKKKKAAKKPAGEKKAAKPKAKKPAAAKAAKPKRRQPSHQLKRRQPNQKPRRHQRRSKLFQTSVCRGYSATKSPCKGYPICSK